MYLMTGHPVAVIHETNDSRLNPVLIKVPPHIISIGQPLIKPQQVRSQLLSAPTAAVEETLPGAVVDKRWINPTYGLLIGARCANVPPISAINAACSADCYEGIHSCLVVFSTTLVRSDDLTAGSR